MVVVQYLFGILLTSLYYPGIAGAATTPRWALLAVALPVVLLFYERIPRWAGRALPGLLERGAAHLGNTRREYREAASLPGPCGFSLIHLIGVLYLTWSAISLSWTPNRLDGIGELIKLVILAQAFVLGSRLERLHTVLSGMALGLLVSCAVLILQLAYPDLVLHTTTHSGLFINSGSLAEISALVIIGLLYESRFGKVSAEGDTKADVSSSAGKSAADHYGNWRGWSHWWRGLVDGANWHWRNASLWLAICLLPCVVLPQSRGAWLALIAAFTVWLWSKSKLSALALMALAVISFTYSLHINFHISSVIQRWGMWSDAASGLTLLGHGIGSFWTDYAPLSNTLDIFLERPEHLHNDWLEIIFEQGVVGAAVCCTVVVVCYRVSPTKAILAGFAAEALVGFPLHVPCTAFIAALCLGHAARNGADIRDLLHDGRAKLCQCTRGRFTPARWGFAKKRDMVPA